MTLSSRTRRQLCLATLLSVQVWGQIVMAESLPRLTQSLEGRGKVPDESVELHLEMAPVEEAPPLATAGGRPERVSRATVYHPTGRTFTISDAQSVISRDEDEDGFYQRLRINFDADVSGNTAWVYAKLYLSLEGGRWNHYFTTDVFTIDGNASDDDYEVVTKLLDGYPHGYYDVLIELYDADYDLLVVNYGPYEDSDLAALPLEDSEQDSDDEGGGGGAMGAEFWLLALLAFIARIPRPLQVRRGAVLSRNDLLKKRP